VVSVASWAENIPRNPTCERIKSFLGGTSAVKLGSSMARAKRMASIGPDHCRDARLSHDGTLSLSRARDAYLDGEGGNQSFPEALRTTTEVMLLRLQANPIPSNILVQSRWNWRMGLSGALCSLRSLSKNMNTAELAIIDVGCALPSASRVKQPNLLTSHPSSELKRGHQLNNRGRTPGSAEPP